MVPSSSALSSLELLIVSNDYSTLKMFVRAWRESGSRIDSAASIACAGDLVRSRKMHGVVVDMRLGGACEFISQTRKSGVQGGPIIVACATTAGEEQAALVAGANFVVQKPISTSKVFDLLTLSGAIEPPQRRFSMRHRLIAPVTIFSDGLQYRALTSDLSQGGMAIRSARVAGAQTCLEFFLEIRSTAVAGRGRIMWCSDNGYAGIQFDSVRCSNPLPFPEWLDKQAVLLQAAS
jgi:CheY-like chemotaxis protein